MNIIAKLFSSSLGKKFIMAITGCALFLFVVGHLLGNLQIFLGPGPINAYGHFLQSKPGLVWATRLGLAALLALHIWSAVKLSAENRAARPINYVGTPIPPAASYASRTMLMSGLIIAAFIIYHLLHFTLQVPGVNFVSDPLLKDFRQLHDLEGRHDVYGMMVAGFRVPLISFFYIAAVGLLCLHLNHGASAMFQSVGLTSKVWRPLIERCAKVVAWAIFLGYSSIPVAILLSYGKGLK